MISRRLHYFSVFVACCTLALVAAGGLVTSHGVGMAVPDWPNTYGYNMFFFPVSRWMGGIFYEHTHRLIASGVGLATTVLALWLHGRNCRPLLRWGGVGLLLGGLVLLAGSRSADAAVLLVCGAASLSGSFFVGELQPSPKWLRRLGTAAFVAVLVQGVLGGLRVILFKDQIGIFHAALAQLFFALVCSIALFTSRYWHSLSAEPGEGPRPGEANSVLQWWVLACTCLIFAQLVLGATMRHQHAGLAVPDFPTAYGTLWPATDPDAVASYNRQRIEITAANPITAAQIVLHMAHRLLGVCILAIASAVAVIALRRDRAKATVLWALLILSQAILGAATVWSNKAADIATAHVLVGALSLALGCLLTIVLFRTSPLLRRTAAFSAALPPGGTLPRPVAVEGSYWR